MFGVDIGCAIEFFLDMAKRHGCTVTGCDVSAYAVEYATGVLKLDVVCSDFRQVALPHPSFDVVTVRAPATT